MALKVSTGLRNYLLATGSLKAALAGGLIKYYNGAVPASADDALVGGNTLITTISNNAAGTGINFDAAAAAGVLAKSTTETWRGINAVSSTPTFYRHIEASGDTGQLSTTLKRLQGEIGVAGKEINLTNPALVSGASETLDFYTVALPTL